LKAGFFLAPENSPCEMGKLNYAYQVDGKHLDGKHFSDNSIKVITEQGLDQHDHSRTSDPVSR
jgi:hypothetical protein